MQASIRWPRRRREWPARVRAISWRMVRIACAPTRALRANSPRCTALVHSSAAASLNRRSSSSTAIMSGRFASSMAWRSFGWVAVGRPHSREGSTGRAPGMRRSVAIDARQPARGHPCDPGRQRGRRTAPRAPGAGCAAGVSARRFPRSIACLAWAIPWIYARTPVRGGTECRERASIRRETGVATRRDFLHAGPERALPLESPVPGIHRITMSNLNWFTEAHAASGSSIGFRTERLLCAEKTRFQNIEIHETTDWGNLMVIDGCIMLTSRDNFLYHEMMSHPALFTHA